MNISAEKKRQRDAEKERAELARSLLKTARIEVSGTVYPGVVIQFGRNQITTEEELRSVCFRYSEDLESHIEKLPLAK